MKYAGHCHCKKVAFDVETDLEGVIECNCSHCEAKGLLLKFAPRTAFTLHSGEDNLTTYKFNKHVIDHVFCKDCGVQAFAFGAMPDGTATVAINVRSLEGVDIAALKRTPYDGRTK